MHGTAMPKPRRRQGRIINELPEAVYWLVFETLDAHDDFTGDEAGKVAYAVEKAVTKALTELGIAR